MSEFITVLALYYLCDATATLRPMTAAEIGTCYATYDTVKIHLIDDADLAPVGTVDRVQQMTAAYLAFKTWEDDNARLVAGLRAEARDMARAAIPTSMAGMIDG